MRCVNVSLIALLIAVFFILPNAILARDYEPVGSPTIQHKAPASRPAPKQVSKPKAATSAKQVKIPDFGKGGSSQQPPQGTQPAQIPASGGSTKADSQSSGKLFGTVEFRRPLDSLPGWLDVLKRNRAESVFYPEKYFNKSTTWQALSAKAQPLSTMERLRLVNQFWNGWPYKEDITNWGKADYWAIPAQFILKSGDCEDYAIAKYFTLKELGLDPASMRIVVLRDTIRNLAHAVLAVYVNGDIYILDNLSNVVLSHKRLGNYSPQFSINEYGRWAHIKGKPSK